MIKQEQIPPPKKNTSKKCNSKPVRETVKSLKGQIERLSTELMTLRGETVSFRMNAELGRRKMESSIVGLKKICEDLRKKNHDLSVAFGEFRCRELLWIASQWVRNANFDIKVNGTFVPRKELIGQIDTFLKGWTFTGGAR